jgi:hypothetical protein
MKISYKSSVLTNAGWRSITITAIAEKTSEKMAKVNEIIAIDGEYPTGYLSRTGAKRQTYNANYVSTKELGRIKRLSACEVE